MTRLGSLSAYTNFYSSARGVTSDGSVIVGTSTTDIALTAFEAFRWTGGVMTSLGDLPDGATDAWAFDVSDDGLIVVGRGSTAAGYEAFIWDADNGMRNLKTVLENDHGLDLTGWTLSKRDGESWPVA